MVLLIVNDFVGKSRAISFSESQGLSTPPRIQNMSHPEFLKQKFLKRECRGQSLLPGFGVSPKNLFLLLLLAAAGGKQGEKRSWGTAPNPR
jgi:hypothetical protein